MDLLKSLKSSYKSDFSLNIGKLITATILSQVIILGTTPLLTRIYSSEDFGIFGLFSSTIAILSTITTLRYESSIVMAESEEEAKSLLFLCLTLVILTTFIIFVVVGFIFLSFPSLFYVRELGTSLFLIPVTLLFSGFAQAFNGLKNRNKEYLLIGLSSVTKATGSSSLKLGLTFFISPNELILVVGNLIGFICELLVLSFQTISNGMYNTRKKLYKNTVFHIMGIKKIFRKYSDFPRYNLPSVLLNSISLEIPVLMLGLFFSISVLGHYFLSYNIMRVPSLFLGLAISQVFYQKAATINKEELGSLVEKLFFILTLVGAPSIIFIGVFGEELFVTIFGSHWRGAGRFSSYLAPMIVFSFCAGAISQVFIITKRQNFLLYSNLSHLVNRIIMIWIGGIFFKSADIAIILFSISSTSLGFLFLIYLFRSINAQKKYLLFFLLYYFLSFIFFTSLHSMLF